MTALTHVHGAYCALLEDLGLAHGTPVVEWHDWAPVVIDDLPIAATGVGGWRYLPIDLTDTVDRSSPELDDSTWTTGPTPFGYEEWNPDSSVAGGAPGKLTRWLTQSAIWLRRTIRTAPGEDVVLDGYVDDFVDVYWNGALIYSKATGAAGPWGPVTIPAAQVRATNLLAVRATDDIPHHSLEASYISVGVAKTSPTPQLLTRHDWTLNPDRTAALVAYSVTTGRATPAQNTEPLNNAVTLARYLAGADLPSTGDRYRLTLNADVAAALGVAEDERPRFTGELTDVDIVANGDLTLVNLAGLGRRTRLTRHPVTMSRPADLDGERMWRILAQVAITLPLEVGTIDAGTVTLLPDAPIATPAQQLADAVTADSLGRLVEHRSGRLDYHDAGHRRGRASRVTLTGADHLIRPFSWRQGVGTIINDATATFGPDDDRDTVQVTDPVSADPDTGVGPYGAQLETRLAGVLDAYALLTDIVGRNSRPAYYLPSVVVDLFRTAGAALPVLLELSHGDKITATDLPPDGAFTAGDVFVEGTTEAADARSWRLELVVADPALAGAGLRWVDLPRFLRWVDVDPALTWLDIATISDPYDLGDPVADGGDADDVTVGLIVNGGDASTTSWDYVLSGALP